MIRLNGPPSPDALDEELLERPVVEQPGEIVRPRADLDGPVDLGVVERDRDLRGEQLDELELLDVEAVARGRVARVSARPLTPSRPRSGTTIRLPSTGPVESNWSTRGSAQLVDHELRLVVLEDPGRRRRSRRAPTAGDSPRR